MLLSSKMPYSIFGMSIQKIATGSHDEFYKIATIFNIKNKM